jgi:hypothetical protein
MTRNSRSLTLAYVTINVCQHRERQLCAKCPFETFVETVRHISPQVGCCSRPALPHLNVSVGIIAAGMRIDFDFIPVVHNIIHSSDNSGILAMPFRQDCTKCAKFTLPGTLANHSLNTGSSRYVSDSFPASKQASILPSTPHLEPYMHYKLRHANERIYFE